MTAWNAYLRTHFPRWLAHYHKPENLKKLSGFDRRYLAAFITHKLSLEFIAQAKLRKGGKTEKRFLAQRRQERVRARHEEYVKQEKARYKATKASRK